MAWFDVISHAKLFFNFFYWPAAKPLAYVRGTLGFRETPVEKHWSNVPPSTSTTVMDSLSQKLVFRSAHKHSSMCSTVFYCRCVSVPKHRSGWCLSLAVWRIPHAAAEKLLGRTV